MLSVLKNALPQVLVEYVLSFTSCVLRDGELVYRDNKVLEIGKLDLLPFHRVSTMRRGRYVNGALHIHLPILFQKDYLFVVGHGTYSNKVEYHELKWRWGGGYSLETSYDYFGFCKRT